jgi:hypothetical protein
MANGITVTSNPDPAQLQSLGVTSWPTWGCGVSTFPWTYDEQETCLLLEGDVSVTPEGGEPVRFGAGDLVVFAAGLPVLRPRPAGQARVMPWSEQPPDLALDVPGQPGEDCLQLSFSVNDQGQLVLEVTDLRSGRRSAPQLLGPVR